MAHCATFFKVYFAPPKTIYICCVINLLKSKVMKQILLTAALLISGAQGVFATGDTDAPKSYNRIYVGWNPYLTNYTYTGDPIDKDEYNFFKLNGGVSLGYTHGFKVAKNLPMYIEVGGRLNYSFGTNTVSDNEYHAEHIEDKNKMVSLTIPVTFTYRFAIGETGWSIAPYYGLTFKGIMLARQTETETWSESSYGGIHHDKYEYNFLKEDKDGDDDADDDVTYGVYDGYKLKKFRIGTEVGVNFTYKGFTLGIHYGVDFGRFNSKKCHYTNEVDGKVTNPDKLTSSNYGISIGYTF